MKLIKKFILTVFSDYEMPWDGWSCLMRTPDAGFKTTFVDTNQDAALMAGFC